jgi:ribosomal protein L21E
MKTSKTKSSGKKQTAKQKKIATVMHEFKEGELHSGKTDTIVTNRKQAIAIALSEADELNK